jgi:uncharacterized paraquat-inducible protein A
MYEKPFIFHPIRCKKCDLVFELVTFDKKIFEHEICYRYCPYCGAEIKKESDTDANSD